MPVILSHRNFQGVGRENRLFVRSLPVDPPRHTESDVFLIPAKARANISAKQVMTVHLPWRAERLLGQQARDRPTDQLPRKKNTPRGH